MHAGTASSFMRVRVSDTVLDKATRFFNATIQDIFNELLQNARRAGASSVAISTRRDDTGYYVSIEDDGRGMFRDDAQIEFGGSGWSDDTLESEDPAGMGIFSLAHRGAEFESAGLRVRLTPAQFSGQEDYRVETSDRTRGTKVTFAVGAADFARVPKAAEAAALYYPLPVHLNGRPLPQQPFISPTGALYRETWRGVEVGVVRHHVGEYASINFYGIQVNQLLPSVSMVERYNDLTVRVNVLDAPELKLVLPARKEVRQDDFFRLLQEECYRAIYRYIATLETHSLPFVDWQRARSLGIDLREAAPCLDSFEFPKADYDAWGSSDTLDASPDGFLVTADIEPEQAVSVERAIALEHIELRLYQEEIKYDGYSWYDRLPKYTNFEVAVIHGDERLDAAEAVEREILRPERIAVIVTLVQPNGDTEIHEWNTDLALYRDDFCYSYVEGVSAILARKASIAPYELSVMLENAYFCPNDDADADSPDTQRQYFRDEAQSFATTLLRSADEALIDRIVEIADRELRWHIPIGKSLRIFVPHRGTGRAIEVEIVDNDPPSA